MLIAWILLVTGTLGILIIGGLWLADIRHDRRLKAMRKKADEKRDDYFVLSIKEPLTPPRKTRAKFLP